MNSTWNPSPMTGLPTTGVRCEVGRLGRGAVLRSRWCRLHLPCRRCSRAPQSPVSTALTMVAGSDHLHFGAVGLVRSPVRVTLVFS